MLRTLIDGPDDLAAVSPLVLALCAVTEYALAIGDVEAAHAATEEALAHARWVVAEDPYTPAHGTDLADAADLRDEAMRAMTTPTACN